MHLPVKQSEMQSRRDSKKIMLSWTLGCVIFLLLLWGAAFAKIDADRKRLIDSAGIEVAARAKTYAEQVLRTVQQIDQLSRVIKYEWERNPSSLNLEEQYRKGVYQTAVYPAAINAQGVAMTGTRNLPKGTYMGDLDFFKLNKNNPDAGLVISYPTPGRGGFSGKTIIRFSRRFEKPDGTFDGVVLIAIEPNFITSFQDDSLLGADDFISVRFLSGPVMASKVARSDFSKNQVYYQETPHFDSHAGLKNEPGYLFFDGVPRIVGWEKLEGYPLVSLAAISEKNVLASYSSTAASYLFLAAVISILLILAAFKSARIQIQEALRRMHIDQVQSTFRLAVDGAREGFYMIRPTYQADGALDQLLIEDCNERAAEMAGIPRHDLIGACGTTLNDGKNKASDRVFFTRVLSEGFNEDEFHVPQGSTHAAGWYQRRAVRSGTGIAVTIRDVSDAKQQAQNLAVMARTDALTGLPNRHWLNDNLPALLEKSHKEGKRIALLYIDLDNFKDINDSLGHKAGDDVLRAVSRSLQSAVRAGDHLARLGGDEFTVIIENLQNNADAGKIGQQVIDTIGSSIAIPPWGSFAFKASVGISIFPSDGEDVDTLLQSADIAMYVAKSEGKAQFRFYDFKFAQKIRERISTERALIQAIRQDEFVVYYQPRADAVSGRLCSMEALVRWHHPERGLLSPLEFIPVAEQSNLIIPLGEAVIEKVCFQIAQWRAAGLPVKPVSINVSALQLKDDRLRHFLASCMQRHEINPALIAIELTESSMVQENGVAPDELRQLRAMGIELQIDDFGTGYSSLSTLQSLDIDVVKIDQSFTRKLGQDQQSNALCEAIISIGRALDIVVVAEGVETLHQLHILQKMGCAEIQGYLIARPLPAEKIAVLLKGAQFFEPLKKI